MSAAGGVSVRNTFSLEMDPDAFSRLLASALASGQFANVLQQNTSSNRKIKRFSIINCPIFIVHSFKVPSGSVVAPTATFTGQQQGQTPRPQFGGYPFPASLATARSSVNQNENRQQATGGGSGYNGPN
jgi:hypothetical protein